MNDIIRKALQLKREKKYDQAFSTFEEFMEKFPTEKTDFCLSNMAHIQYLKGNYPKSEQLAKSALQYNSRNWFSLGILGEIALKQNQAGDALQLFEEAHHIQPADQYLITRLAKIFQQQNRIQKAFDLLNRSILEFPDESRLHECLGDLFKSQMEMEKARASYQKAIELKSDNHYAFRQWIATMEAEKSKSEILGEIQKLLKLPSQKENPFLQDYYSQLLKQLGRVNESTAHLESSMQADPRSLFRKTRLAANYNQLHKYQDVISLLEPEYKHGVVDLYLFQNLGKAYLGAGNKAAARDLLVNAVKAFPHDRKLRTLLMQSK